MSIDSVGYRGWSEQLTSPWIASWSIARTGLLLVLRRKLFWILLGFALLNFLFMFALIYLKAQLSAQNPAIAQFVDRILTSVTGTGDSYRNFMFLQGTVTMLMLAFAGEVLVGSDFQRGGLTFYLSRRISRRHYALGKLLGIGLLVSLTTTIPAVILFIEYGAMTDSFTYLSENWRILVGILGYGTIMAVVLSLVLFAMAAWLQKTVPLVMAWAALFVLLPVLGGILRRVQDDRHWLLIMLWRDLRLLGSWCFGSVDSGEETELVGWAACIVVLVCAASVAAIIPRLRAVRVVQ
jgi:ABC-type transport system involved in multi-copper enzyme maturation permease subunit